MKTHPEASHLEALRLACAAPVDHPDFDTVQKASAAVSSYVLHYFTSLSEGSVGRTARRDEMEALLRESPPETGREFTEVLHEVQDKIVANVLRPGHPRFTAYIPGAPSFISVLGDWLCAGLNLFAGVWQEAPAATLVEIIVLDWFKEFLGYPAEARGILTGGGSEANLTALVVAREPLSYADRQRAILYVSEQRHWSVDRAAKVMGMRPDQVRLVPADREGRLTPELLMKAGIKDAQAGLLPWAVVATAGTTNTGTIDPLDDLATFCQTHQLWLHVDAAYGWPAVLTDEGKMLLRGIHWADSITLDPHKWFGQTFEAGCLLVRRGEALEETFSLRPEYMQDVTPRSDEINFADHGIALTRRFRALKIWLSIKVLGVGWFRRLVEHCCHLADYAQGLLEQTRFEILSPRQLSIVCFRYVPASPTTDAELDRLNLDICRKLLDSGQAFLSTTRLDGRVALRLCFVNYRTTAADVEQTVRLLREIGDGLT